MPNVVPLDKSLISLLQKLRMADPNQTSYARPGSLSSNTLLVQAPRYIATTGEFRKTTMEELGDDAKAAIAAIESAKLTPTEHDLFIFFVKESVDSGHAARFILQLIDSDDGVSREEVFSRLKRTIKKLLPKFARRVDIPPDSQALVQRRDGQRSSTIEGTNQSDKTRRDFAHVIPPTIFEDDDMGPQGELFPIMEGFLTAPKISELQALLHSTTDQDILKNLWTLSPSIHAGIRNGQVNLQPFTKKFYWADEDEIEKPHESEITYWVIKSWSEQCGGIFFSDGKLFEDMNLVTMHTSDPSVYSLPSPVLLRIQYRLAKLFHYFYVEDRIAEGWQRRPRFALGKISRRLIQGIWRLVPKVLRVSFYLHLLRSKAVAITGTVWQLPFKLMLKQCRRKSENEANALKVVEKYTNIPTPLFVDSFQDENGELFLVTTVVRGQWLNEVYHRMSYGERDRFVDDMKRYVAQLRRLPTIYKFANTIGGTVYDHRIPDIKGGPFKDEAEFNKHLISPLGSYKEPGMAYAHSLEHRCFFTHADLHSTNILIEGGRISGIIDWECAGYFPEYWEFTKAMHGVLNRDSREDMWRRVFDHKYEAELKAERIRWRLIPPF